MSTVTEDVVVHRIPMADLYADDDFNCRGRITPMDVIELAKNIEEQGLIQPIIVQPYDGPNGEHYRVVAGYRRHMAHKVNKQPYINCIIKTGISDDDARFLNLAENLNRKDLDILQEAKAIKTLLDKGYSQEEIRQKLNTSRAWVQVRVYALDLPPIIQKEVQAGWIKQEHIMTLNSLKKNPERQLEVALEIKEKKQKGERVRVKTSAKSVKRDPNLKMVRDKKQIQRMVDHIIRSIGANFGTRCLAWANGEISTTELFNDIKEEASDRNKTYVMPFDDITMEL